MKRTNGRKAKKIYERKRKMVQQRKRKRNYTDPKRQKIAEDEN